MGSNWYTITMQEHLINRRRRRVLSTVGLALLGSGAAVTSASAAEHETQPNAEAHLTGEAHGVDTSASGHAVFHFDLVAETVHYRLDVSCIRNVTQAHLHLGGESEDGPVIAWLYPEDVQEPRTLEGVFTGTLAEGTLTGDDIVGPLEGLSFEEAAAVAEEEGEYVNVHTEQHPDGEIRGQIEPVAGTE
jgi:hypothetical protein